MQIKNQINFLIPGEPVAQIRPRFSARLVNGKIITNVRRDQPEQEGYFRQIISKQLPDDFEILQGPVVLGIVCKLKRPKIHFGTGANSGLVKTSAPLWPLKIPDWDNLGKFVCDCLNGLIWIDDKQVVSGKVDKIFAKNPCTIVNVCELASN